MKKMIIYATMLLIITILTVGSTFAYFSATLKNNSLKGNTAQLDVIYKGDTALNEALKLVNSKEQGYNRTISLQLAQNSLEATANLYIYVEQITSTLATDALNWELYQVIDGEEKHIKSGSFIDCGDVGETKSKCTANQKIYMLTSHKLSKEEVSQFVIYLWLNGAKVDNTILGATFKGYIGAETENISGILG